MANPLSPIQANALSPGYRQNPRQYGLPIVNQYGQYQVGGPLSLKTKEGQLDAMLELTPVGDARALKRAKLASRPVLKENLMGGATAQMTDPYAAAFEAATVMPMAGDAATLAKMGAASLPGILALMARRNQALGAKAMAPQARHMQGVIGSTGAKTANLELLAKAEQMKAAGHSADDIYANTRWWLDHPDGRPRFEIDDSESLYRLGGARLEHQKWYRENVGEPDYGNMTWGAKQRDLFRHGELKEAYPGTENIQTWIGPETGRGGSYSETEDWIRLNKDHAYGLESGKSINLHELQHAIQGRENMARGGSPSDFAVQPSQVTASQQVYDSARNGGVIMERLRAAGIRNVNDPQFESVFRQAAEDAGMPLNRAEEGLISIMPENGAIMHPNAIADKIESARRTYERNLSESVTKYDAMEQYRVLAGEAEARLVQDRMNMSMDERLANPFYKNFDVPLDEQIVRMEGGTAQSLPPR